MTTPSVPSRDAFAPLVGSRLSAEAPDSGSGLGPLELELELVRLDDSPAPPGHELFSLLFAGPPDAPVAQGTFRLRCPDLGAIDLFLVPIGADGRAVRYEAVVNRSTDLDPVRS